MHNVSGDDDAIRLIRVGDGVPHLIRALNSEDDCVACSAAGATQNVSRERASRVLFRRGGAVESLARLLGRGGDSATQARAAGALLNILGPELDDGHGGAVSKEGEVNEDEKENDTGIEGTGTGSRRSGRSSGSGRPPADGSERRALGKLLSSAIALTAVWDGLFETEPAFDFT